MYGAYQPFAAQARGDEAEMRRDARASGLFPTAGKSHEAMLEAQLAKIVKGQEVTAVRARRMAADNQINSQLENERLQSLLRTQRMPGLRGQASRMRNSQRVAELNVQYG